MGESLWWDLMAYVETTMADALSADNYETLAVESSRVISMLDMNAWDGWDKPALVVAPGRLRRDVGPHGNGLINFEKRYTIDVIGICVGSDTTALRDAAILEKRIEEELRTWVSLPAIANTYNEYLQQWTMGESGLNVYVRAGCDPTDIDACYGVATVQLVARAMT